MSLQGRFLQLEQDIRAYRQEEKDHFLNTPEYTKKDYEGALEGVPITFDTYQEGTSFTSQPPPEMPKDVYCALGLAGECGELAEVVLAVALSSQVGKLIEHTKKRWRNDKGVLTDERKEKIIAEAGDVLWYYSSLLLSYDIKMSDVAKYNQLKLVSRKKNGTIKADGSNR